MNKASAHSRYILQLLLLFFLTILILSHAYSTVTIFSKRKKKTKKQPTTQLTTAALFVSRPTSGSTYSLRKGVRVKVFRGHRSV